MTIHPMETDSNYSVSWTEALCVSGGVNSMQKKTAGLSLKVNPGELSSFQRLTFKV